MRAAILAGVLAGAAVLAWSGSGPGWARRRLGSAAAPGVVPAVPARAGARGRTPAPAGAVSSRTDPGGRTAVTVLARGLAVAAAALAGLAVAGSAGAAAGLVLAALLDRRLAVAGTRADRDRGARLRADLPRAAELLAACLAAGATPLAAADAVAGAVGGPVGSALRRVVALQRLGGDPPTCWLSLSADPELAGLGRALARAAESGTALVPVLQAEAAVHRAEQRLAARAALARVGVHAAAPLGLCFLPAFLLIGIVPVIVGLGSGVLA